MIYRDELERVYQLIEKPENWCQKRYTNGDAMCLSEAISRCDTGYFGGMQRYMQWTETLGIEGEVCDWNDVPLRTHADILALLRSAIERAPVRP